MNIEEHFKELHHAYLLEGDREETISGLLSILEEKGVNVSSNPDFYQLIFDTLKIEDALSLRDMASRKSFGSAKKIFLLCANAMTRDAQGVLLKMFEEPSLGTHFFIVVPDASDLFSTLRSRMYFISGEFGGDLSIEAEKFVSLPPQKRIDFLKSFLKEESDIDSTRARAGRFLNALENVLHDNLKKEEVDFFDQIFAVREHLRQPGSSVKNLMESLALVIPVI